MSKNYLIVVILGFFRVNNISAQSQNNTNFKNKNDPTLFTLAVIEQLNLVK
jgi:hypothetical protein